MTTRSYTRYGKYVTGKKKAPCTPSLWGKHKAKRYVIEDATKKEKRHKGQHEKKTKTRTRRGEVGPPHPPHTQPTPQRPAHALSLQGEKCAVGQIERYVFRITHNTHFCYTSTGPLLCFSSAFWSRPCQPTTRTNQGMTHPSNHTPHAHTRTHTATTPRTTWTGPPHATHTNTKRHTAHTHTPRPKRRAPRAPQPGVASGPPPPQPVDPSQEWRGTTPRALGQEWRGTNHSTRWRTQARSGGAPQPNPSARSGKGPTTTAQRRTPARSGTAQHPGPSATSGGGPTPHTNHTHRNTSPKPEPKEAGTTKHGPPAHHTHATTHTSACGRPTLRTATPHHQQR